MTSKYIIKLRNRLMIRKEMKKMLRSIKGKNMAEVQYDKDSNKK